MKTVCFVAPMSESSLDSRKKPSKRRIAALILPELPCELVSAALSERQSRAPFAVISVAHENSEQESDVDSSARLVAVNESARRCGIRVGQSVAEASTLISGLAIKYLEDKRIEQALLSAYPPRLAHKFDRFSHSDRP